MHAVVAGLKVRRCGDHRPVSRAAQRFFPANELRGKDVTQLIIYNIFHVKDVVATYASMNSTGGWKFVVCGQDGYCLKRRKQETRLVFLSIID